VWLTCFPGVLADEFSIGDVFDEEGNFWEDGLAEKVRVLVDRFKKKKYDDDKKTK
jgi:hypothetical protein